MDCKDRNEALAPAAGDNPVRVFAAVSDLLFATKISVAARQAGCSVEFIRKTGSLADAIPSEPCLVIVDLNEQSLDPIALITNIKTTTHGRNTQVIAFLSHVQLDLKREAEKAGADLVLPRSVLSQNLYDLLRQRSCHL
jgi:CheY-like chemotaxis protein